MRLPIAIRENNEKGKGYSNEKEGRVEKRDNYVEGLLVTEGEAEKRKI